MNRVLADPERNIRSVTALLVNTFRTSLLNETNSRISPGSVDCRICAIALR